MKIEKTFSVQAAQDVVWQFITSPEQVAPCIPGCEGAEKTGDSTYKASIKVKVGPIKTRFVVEIEAIEERPPEFASYLTKGEEGTKSSRLKASSTLALKKLNDANTEVTYTSEINLLGRLGKFGSGMMQKVADSIGNEFVANLKEQVEK
ncbi:MAG: carbon monoxide dehydrogenase subunit G [Gammaproteobacteria bacterium]|jgi:carbon monoxide dehydrogenase subunit G